MATYARVRTVTDQIQQVLTKRTGVRTQEVTPMIGEWPTVSGAEGAVDFEERGINFQAEGDAGRTITPPLQTCRSAALAAAIFYVTGSLMLPASAMAGDTLPPIHYDQTSALTLDGVPPLENNYRTMLDHCRKSGLPTHALTDAEAGKLGRLHVDAWLDQGRRTIHTESWTIDVSTSPACQFSLVHDRDETEFDDADGRATTINWMTHQGDVQELGPVDPPSPMPDSDADLTEAERMVGWSKLGSDSAAGAPCTIWQDDQGSQFCIWNAGGKWGYSANGFGALKDGQSEGAIVLWARPGKGPAWKLDTSTFTVGTPLDDAVFNVPGDIAIVPGPQ